MTEKRRYLIEYAVFKPAVDALALGAGSAAFATVLQGPALNWSLIGGGFSLFWYWGTANLTKPKKAKTTRGGPGSIVVNSVNGSRKVSRKGFEFQPYQPGYVSRETFGEMVRRWVKGKPRIRQAPLEAPAALRIFVFHSYYKGPVELSEDDVCRFLNAAWRYRKWGSGLGKRRWVRNLRLRPQWYKDLGTHWYYALLALIGDAQQTIHRQLVVCTGFQQYALVFDPHTTLKYLKRAEAIKRGTTAPPPADDIFNRGGSSF